MLIEFRKRVSYIKKHKHQEDKVLRSANISRKHLTQAYHKATWGRTRSFELFVIEFTLICT